MSQTLILPSPKQGAARSKHRNGHSRGLYVLCASIAAERFSFFLLTATLVLFLNERVGLSSAHSVEMVGYFLCATYLTPLWGGRLCDGRMGCRRVAALGCVLQTAGYCAFLIGNFAALLCGLILLAIGSGFFKASTQTLMGGLSADGDQQRERSFSALYMVINVSALTAPLLAGVLQQHTSWRGNYVVASLGTLLSGVSLSLGGRWQGIVKPRLCVATAPLTSAAQQHPHQQLALILLAGAAFTAGAVQSHSSLLLWVRDHTERHVGSFETPISWFAAAPAALVLLLSPLLSLLFGALRRKHREPATRHKILVGLLLSFAAIVPIWAASLLTPNSQKVSAAWVLGCLAILAVSELLVVALAPAEITRIAPRRRQGRWLSYWFVAQAVGNMVGGLLHF